MLEKLVSDERHESLARYHPSSEEVFTNNDSFDYIKNEVLNSDNQKGWKKAGLKGLNGAAHATYGLLEGVSRVTESGLRLAGKAVEYLGRNADDKLQAIQTDQYDDEINWPKSISQNIRSLYGSLKEGFLSVTSTKVRNNLMVGLALGIGLYSGSKMLPNIEFSGDEDKIAVVTPESSLPKTPKPYPLSPSSPHKPDPYSTSHGVISVDELVKTYGKDDVRFAQETIKRGAKLREQNKTRCQSPKDISNKCKTLRGLQAKYPGNYTAHLFGFFDDNREVANITMLRDAYQNVMKEANKKGVELPFHFVASTLAKEGHSLDVDNYKSSSTNGFAQYGLDTFGDNYQTSKSLRTLLPKGFNKKFTAHAATNELGQVVKTANFNSKSDAFHAFVAELAWRQMNFTKKAKCDSMPEDQKLFLTYELYNCGQNSLNKKLRAKNTCKTLEKHFKDKSLNKCQGNAHVALKSALWLDQMKAFPES
ncbi:hypothetical protein HOD05_04670 [Candidatus Woesearchaeota archaeon]|jgi:hypothetical protein|nr:hypothetical protein [Candidatus Woesearchaeota archaeon]MBT4150448.1 hypothetical protein [Candidatus Woesearchaeota archaeon]MBT4247643.1 hypothetical protein [Candidatus Woesearchaeota archaeon]MBT4434484.1 hypothetical protein [Candidatus Woesearchaeota archaeon]MBT7331662.1 hypothetical protein [Candidatus Woesearchaeota archaeon]